METPKLGSRVRHKDDVGVVVRSAVSPMKRVKGPVKLIGEPSVTILFSGGTTPAHKVTVPQSEWDDIEVLDEGSG